MADSPVGEMADSPVGQPSSSPAGALSVWPVHVPARVAPGDRLGPLLLQAEPSLRNGDVVVVASKVVSKAEDRVVDFDGDWPALVASQSRRILRRRGDLFITETEHGFVCANAGIDRSNVEPNKAVLLPRDPDRSAHVLRNEVRGIANVDVAVVVSDTNGRAWREATTEVALGCAGLIPVEDLRGGEDAYGTKLSVTQNCIADELAGAAGLVMKKAASTPFVIIRGVDPRHFGDGSIAEHVVRRYANDLFR